MTNVVTNIRKIRRERAADRRDAVRDPDTEPAGLQAVVTHLGVLAALTEPEAVIALANGVPNLDDATLVRLLDEQRAAA